MTISIAIQGLLLGVAAAPAAGPEPVPRHAAVFRTPQESPAPSDSTEALSGALPEALVEQLGSPDWREREEAFAELERRGAAVREALEAAADHEDPEVRWRVARLLDRLGRRDEVRQGSGLRRLEPSGSPGGGEPEPRRLLELDSLGQMERELEQMIRRLEKLHGNELHGNELRGFFRGRPFHFRFFDDPFGILDEVLEGRGERDLDLRPGSRLSRTEIVDGEQHAVTVTVNPDGSVVAEERRGEDLRRVEAPSLEQFRIENPDLAGILAWGPGFVPRSGQGRTGEVPPPQTRPEPDGLRPLTPPPGPAVPEPGLPRLGVRVEPVHPALAQYFGLAPGVGRVVVEVLPGTVAETLGLRPKDIVLAIDGHEILGVTDVRAALSRAGGSPSEIEVIRDGSRQTLKAR
jgi:hypothetical protein